MKRATRGGIKVGPQRLSGAAIKRRPVTLADLSPKLQAEIADLRERICGIRLQAGLSREAERDQPVGPVALTGEGRRQAMSRRREVERAYEGIVASLDLADVVKHALRIAVEDMRAEAYDRGKVKGIEDATAAQIALDETLKQVARRRRARGRKAGK